jgi:hypothetical protein
LCGGIVPSLWSKCALKAFPKSIVPFENWLSDVLLTFLCCD